ncbi:aminopeptidase [Candidatus Dojkabacteria bacterium]|nr:aminopeptidase [Candidatus Dojkabacteria bacterium]
MNDQRNKKLAQIFVDHSIKVKKKDRVVISTSDLLPIDLIREIYSYLLQKDADVYLDIMGFNFILDRSSFGDLVNTFYKNANKRQIENPPVIYKQIADWGDKFIRITTMDNYKHLSRIDSGKIQAKSKVIKPWFDQVIKKDWVLTYYPTNAMAQNANKSYEEMLDFYFKSVLVDYDKMEKEQSKLEKIIDNGNEVHIVGEKTDLTLSIKGRTAKKCFGERNIPDGEVFTGPVENKTQGHIYFEFPGVYSGKEVYGIYLEFKDGKVIKYECNSNQEDLDSILGTDEGALRLGEFSFGTNYGITEHMKETLFDEKIGGTIHLALGMSYDDEKGWGKNQSAIHWDIVKDTRRKGSFVEVDGKKVLVNGKFNI